jgi:predicted cupin superfamily sugar epimerase
MPSLLLKTGVFAFSLIALYALWQTFSSQESLPFSPSPSVKPPTNVAVIIEDRPLSNLASLILYFSSILGPSWPIKLFTTGGSGPDSPAFRRAVEDGRIAVHNLPDGVRFNEHRAVTEFLTKPWFWEQLAPAGHVFMFQADSIICANSQLRVEDFLEYDFVGAPIDVPADPSSGHGEGYNGGLSLRNRTMMLDIVKKFSWQAELDEGKISLEGCVTQRPCLKFEDQWFYHKMKEMPEAKLPAKEVAATFAVETVWYDTPLAYHQVERWNSGRMNQVAEWCPEYKMATTDLITAHGKTPPAQG